MESGQAPVMWCLVRHPDFSATMDLSSLDGKNGFRLDGVAAYDYLGRSVSNAGDVNGDGFDDLIVGAFRADVNGENRVPVTSYSGAAILAMMSIFQALPGMMNSRAPRRQSVLRREPATTK
jgi:hypothetical protein